METTHQNTPSTSSKPVVLYFFKYPDSSNLKHWDNKEDLNKYIEKYNLKGDTFGNIYVIEYLGRILNRDDFIKYSGRVLNRDNVIEYLETILDCDNVIEYLDRLLDRDDVMLMRFSGNEEILICPTNSPAHYEILDRELNWQMVPGNLSKECAAFNSRGVKMKNDYNNKSLKLTM